MAVGYSILNYGMRKREHERKWLLKNVPESLGGWYLFCISCVGVGVRGEEEQGNSVASSCIDLWQHPPYDDVTREMLEYGNLQSLF